MAKVTISGVGPLYDGEYDLGFLDSLNGNELHLIKQVAGVRLGEIDEALRAADYDVYVSVAACALWRNGKVTKQTVLAVVDLMMAAEAGVCQFDWTDVDEDEGDDASPPARLPSEPEPPSSSDESSKPSSETSSSTSDDRPEMTLVSTGAPG